MDIDRFIWSQKNEKYHPDILEAVKQNNSLKLSEIYKIIMTENKAELQKNNRIRLLHHPINCKWLEIDYIAVIKPEYKLFLENISNRGKGDPLISIDSWNLLDNTLEYTSYEEFENMMLEYAKTYFD